MGEGARDAVTGTPLPARPGGSGDAPRAETRQIRTEIERTRADLGETIDAIQDRLRPAQIAKDAKERVKDVTRQGMQKVSRQATRIAGEVAAAGRDTTDIVVERVRTRPMPFALAGAGVGALFAARAFRKRPSRQRPVEEETWQDRERRALGNTASDGDAGKARHCRKEAARHQKRASMPVNTDRPGVP